MAPVASIVEAAGKPPSSSSVTVQKLLPLLPRAAISVTTVPEGEVSLNRKSPLNVCVTDAFVSPMALLQPGSESRRKFTSLIAPTTPLTVSGILTPAALLSGISTDGPV